MNNEEPWYGHKFKKINDTTWKCGCGEEIHTCIPEGYALVPVEATTDMTSAGMFVLCREHGNAASIYKAMVKVAQE